MNLRCTVNINRHLGAPDFYESIINPTLINKDNSFAYDRILMTLNNPEPITQFMSLYQFLMELLSEGNLLEQKNVTQYFKERKEVYHNISFHPTRRPNKSFEEDIFTYTRSEIGHYKHTENIEEYKRVGVDTVPLLIKPLVSVLNDVIQAKELCR